MLTSLLFVLASVCGAFSFSLKHVTRNAVVATGSALALIVNSPVPSVAASDPNPSKSSPMSYGLKKDRLLPCKTLSNCISSSSVNSIDKYGRPWAYSENKDAKEEFEQVKREMQAQEGIRVVDTNEDKLYIRAEARSAVPPTGTDDIELIVNGLDHIITYRSNSRDTVFAGTSVVPDGGANRNRLSALQRRLGVKEMTINSEIEEYLEAKPDFFSYQKIAQSPSQINFLDNSVPDQ
jgi:uncharacterized protein (DUF1499 family)